MLLGLEIVVPGIFLLWIGIAAIIVGALTLMIASAAYLGLAAADRGVPDLVAGLGLCRQTGHGEKRRRSDEPLLNQRGEQLIGRAATLAEPIEEGRGRVSSATRNGA